MLKTEMIGFDDLTKDEQNEQPNNGCGKEEANYLRVTHKGNTMAIYSDAMEPEDCVFYRDLKWVASALTGAYQLGKSEA